MLKQVIYFGNPYRLSIENRQLIIKTPDEKGIFMTTATRPIEDIGVVIIDSPRVVLTASVISSLMEEGAVIMSCDSKHLPVGLMYNINGHSEQTERLRHQIEASLPLRKRLWQQTVSAKIKNQGLLINHHTRIRHDNMFIWAGKVKSGDSDNLEGRAAAYYWRNLWEENPSFRRERNSDGINGMLNYGYAVLRAIVCRALVSSGLHPSIGIFHRNKYNAYCLADDIMEPYRPYVDLRVITVLKDLNSEDLTDKLVKRALLSIPTMDVVIEGRRHPLMTGVTETTSSLYKCYANEAKKIKYPEMEF